MSFEHWNRFIESFKADQAARGTQRIRAETPTGSRGRGRQLERKEVKTHGKEVETQDCKNNTNNNEQSAAAAASRKGHAGSGRTAEHKQYLYAGISEQRQETSIKPVTVVF